MKPVLLPPGRAKLSTRPAPTGSAIIVNTIGTVRVACSNGHTGSPLARMTSGRARPVLPRICDCARHRRRPSGVDPHVAAIGPAQLLQALAGTPPDGPALPDRPRHAHEHADAPHPLACCARAASGHAAAAPPSSVMNSRRFIRSPRRRGRAAGGTVEAERLSGLEVDHQLDIWSAFCTGRSAGFSPLRMRSTYEAERRTLSTLSGP